MRDPAYRMLAEAVLVVHQRRDGGGGCLCDELELGESWAAHVAEALETVGALRRPPAEEARR